MGTFIKKFWKKRKILHRRVYETNNYILREDSHSIIRTHIAMLIGRNYMLTQTITETSSKKLQWTTINLIQEKTLMVACGEFVVDKSN